VSNDGTRQPPTLHIRLVAGERTLRTWDVEASEASIGSSDACTITASGDESLRPHHLTLYVEGDVVTAIPAPGAAMTIEGRKVDVGIVSPQQVLGAGKLQFRVEVKRAVVEADPSDVVAWLSPKDRPLPIVLGLRVLAPGHAPKVVALPERSLLVGAGKAHLRIPFDEVADKHATVKVTGDGTLRVVASDDQVIRVNGTLMQRATLRIGDELMIGVVRMAVVPPPALLQLPKGPVPGSEEDGTQRISTPPRLRTHAGRTRHDELDASPELPASRTEASPDFGGPRRPVAISRAHQPPPTPPAPPTPLVPSAPAPVDEAARAAPPRPAPSTLPSMLPPRVDPSSLGGPGRAVRPTVPSMHDEPPSTADPRTADPRTELGETKPSVSPHPRVDYASPRAASGESYGRVEVSHPHGAVAPGSEGGRNLGTAPIPMPNVPSDRARRRGPGTSTGDEHEDGTAPSDLGNLLIDAHRRQDAISGPTVLGASIIRVVDNRIADTITLHAEQEYVSSGGELRCWVEDLQVHFEVGPKVRAADGFALRRASDGKQMGAFGEGGRVSLVGSHGRYRIDAVRVPMPPRSWSDTLINVTGVAMLLSLLLLCGWMVHAAGLIDLSLMFGEPTAAVADLGAPSRGAPSTAAAEQPASSDAVPRVRLPSQGLQPAIQMDDKVITDHRDEVLRCYQAALAQNPTLQGQLAMQWKVTAQGAVQEARVVQSSLSGPNGGDEVGAQVGECVREAIGTWRFPTRLRAPTVIDHVFEFRLAKE
jgi:hypothetical protein